MTLARVNQLSDDELLTYFSNNARYDASSPHQCYSIRVGAKVVFDADVERLRQKFFALVRNRPDLHPDYKP